MSEHNSYKKFRSIRNLASSWLVKHPTLWVNPLSIGSVLRALTGNFRVLPDFIIVGAQKCGTTTLYNLLLQHPDIFPALWKEVNFFDKNFHRGTTWYKANFPTIFQKFFYSVLLRRTFLTGESSPYYIFHPLAIERISKTLPKTKLIIILRNPIERAYSQYNMEKRNGFEELSFDEALKLETKRLEGEKEKMEKNDRYQSTNYQCFSYLSRGHYVKQIKNVMKYFPKNQVLIIFTEEMEKDPNKILNTVLKFLNQTPISFKDLKKYNIGSYEKINPETRKFLKKYFNSYNQELFDYLGRKSEWN